MGVATVVGWPLFVGDGRLMRAIGAEDGIDPLEDGRAVVLGGYEPVRGHVRISVVAGRREKTSRIPAVAVTSRSYFNESIPRIVVSEGTARRLGLGSDALNHLLTRSSSLSPDEVARAREVAERLPGVFVNSNDDYLPAYAAARSIATAASLVLALGILAIAVALVAAESRRSHQILVAVGAGALSHRMIMATTAASLALMAALVAIPAGFLPTAVIQASNEAGRPIVVPWGTFAILLGLVPLLAASVAGLSARTPKLGSLLTPST